MLTYALWSWPTILLSLGAGALLGWWVRGSRSRDRVADTADVRLLTFRHEREVADRDAVIAVLRQEVADEATESARLRRLLGAPSRQAPPPVDPPPPQSQPVPSGLHVPPVGPVGPATPAVAGRSPSADAVAARRTLARRR